MDADARGTTAVKRCVAFVLSSVSRELWLPCTTAAAASDKFCVEHRNALDGAVIGLRAEEKLDENRSAKRKRDKAQRRERQALREVRA